MILRGKSGNQCVFECCQQPEVMETVVHHRRTTELATNSAELAISSKMLLKVVEHLPILRPTHFAC